MKAPIKSYFTITKKEWNGLVVLVILIAGVLAAPYVYQLFRKDSTINFKDFDKAAAQLGKAEKNGSYVPGDSPRDDQAGRVAMFPFDPNAITIQQWQQLGLTEHQAEIIVHYKAKGGRFYKKEDLKKIYAVTAEDYQRLEPYINLPDAGNAYKKIKPGETVELNNADSTRLTELTGIGPSLAVRIIRYRDRLGGFYRKEQLGEIFGIDSSKFVVLSSEITINPQLVKKIDINSISFDQLRLFPYFTYKQVNAIIQYRTQHGNYTSVADMKNIAILDEQTLQKTAPYLSFK